MSNHSHLKIFFVSTIIVLFLSGCSALQLSLKPTEVPTSTPKPSVKLTPSAQEVEAWQKITCMDTQSLQAYVNAFPSGAYANDTQLIISLIQKIERIKNGRLKPGFTISFEQLGERWQSWKKSPAETGALGIYRDDRSMGVFTTVPGCSIIFDSVGIPALPTGDGSILAVRTAGNPLEYFKGIVMESYGDEVLYFAVIEGKGLVHIHGFGKVTMPDSSEHDLK